VIVRVHVFVLAFCAKFLTLTVAVLAQGDMPSAKLELDEMLNLEVKDLADTMDVDAADLEGLKDVAVDWRKAFLESGLFIVLMNGKRAALEPGTQAGMKGPFFKDYWRSIKGSLKWKWKDGDDFFINYVRHPAEGATFAFIMRQNDPNSIDPASCGFSVTAILRDGSCTDTLPDYFSVKTTGFAWREQIRFPKEASSIDSSWVKVKVTRYRPAESG